MHPHSIFMRILVASVLLTPAFAVTAGKITPVAVSINDTDRTARGSTLGARQSQDDEQFIGCTNEGNGVGVCMAANALGVNRNCVTNDPGMLAAMNRVGPNSHIRFGWNIDGTCRLVQVFNASMFQL